MENDDDGITNFMSLYVNRMKTGFDDADQIRNGEGKYTIPEVEAFRTNVHEVTRLIILTDIVNFSVNDSITQLSYLYLFQFYVASFTASFNNIITIRDFISTGDGTYIIADECDPRDAVDYLVALIGGFRNIPDRDGRRIPIRVSALLGKCIPFLDVSGHKNYIGEGMNEAQRILSCGQRATEDALSRDAAVASSGADVRELSGNSLYLGDSLADLTDDEKSSAERVFRFRDVPDKHNRTRNITVLQGIKMTDSSLFLRWREWARERIIPLVEDPPGAKGAAAKPGDGTADTSPRG